jgi:tRNA threonylcarbamoyladenosine biosynthesis protein TsaE
MAETVFEIASPEEMQRLGERIAEDLRLGDVLMLHGDLGAGKTTLTQGIAAGLGIEGPVQSPTFTLVREHRGHELTLYHLDLYRLSDPDELESVGYEVYLDPPDGVSVIEWPERAGDWLPDRFRLLHIDHLGGDRRRVTIRHVSGPAS